MEVGQKRKLRTVILKYVATLGIFIVLVIVANFLLFPIYLLACYPANYSEVIVEKNRDKLEEVSEVDIGLLTPMCQFGVYSEDGRFLYGNISEEDKYKMWDRYEEGDKSLDMYMKSIKRKDEILLVKYPLSLQYKSATLRKLLPNPEIVMLSVFLAEVVLVIFLWSSIFAKKVHRELHELLIATEKIGGQNLDFEVGESKIQEIDEVLKSMESMKTALKESLQKQWSVEQERREQIQSLAHDVKTPLAIVKGNAELMQETKMTEEQQLYSNYIYENSSQMEEYIEKLLIVSRRGELEIEEYEFSIELFLRNLSEQAEALCSAKNMDLDLRMELSKGSSMRGNEEDLIRAFMNIISNAVDFSPEHSLITVEAKLANDKLDIVVEDEGTGFSDKMLKYGKKQLVMGDESRTAKGHHGMGLYIADTIIERHHGKLTLANSTNGGVVTISIPIDG